jgi:hypothetical protein
VKESQLHQAFSHWLDSRGVPYVHSRTDRRTTTAKGDPDYYIFWCSKVLSIEIKVGRNKLSAEQEKRIAYLRRSGNKVVVARSLEECIDACHNILCIKDCPRGFDADYAEEFAKMKETVAGVGYDYHPNLDGPAEPIGLAMDANGNIPAPVNGKDHFIGKLGVTDWLFEGSGAPGTVVKPLRRATAADILELRRFD